MNNSYFKIPETIDFSKYEQEPIHLSGHIQPHGVFIALEKPDLIILQISENIEQFFGISPESLLGKNLNCLLSLEQIQLITDGFKNDQCTFIHLLEIPTHHQENSSLFIGMLHEVDGFLILELEPHTVIEVNPLLACTHLLERAVFHISQSAHLCNLYHIIAQEVRRITQFDRVMVYRFESDYSGVVVAEDKQDDLESYLGLHYPAFDIPHQARELYYKNWLRVINHLSAKSAAYSTKSTVTKRN